MKTQVLKFWQSGPHVIRPFLVSVFIMLNLNLSSQDDTIKDEGYYTLIEKVVLEAKIIGPDELDKLHNFIKNGKLTQQDSIKYVQNKKNSTPIIFKITKNSALKKVLEESLKSGLKSLNKYFTDEEVKCIIDNIPEEKSLQNNFSKEIFLTEPDLNRRFGHFFSSLVSIKDNEYLLYHFNLNNNIYGTEELIVVAKIGDGYKIKYRINYNRWNFEY